MPAFHPVSLAFRDLTDGLAYHGLNILQAAFDMTCVVALGACVYATSLNTGAASPGSLPSAEAQNSVQTGGLGTPCPAQSGPALAAQGSCITAQVLAASIGT